MSTMVDGMRGLEEQGHLTMLTTWTVTFSSYAAFTPVVAVPPDTSLDEVERIARQALLVMLGGNVAEWAPRVAQLSVERLERCQSVTLHPSVG
jgi:hypothetical protein